MAPARRGRPGGAKKRLDRVVERAGRRKAALELPGGLAQQVGRPDLQCSVGRGGDRNAGDRTRRDHTSMMVQTEFPFTLPRGYVDADGTLQREGIMRLANAS